MLKLGSIEINKLAIGDNELEKAYLGSVLIYEKAIPMATISVTAGTGISAVTGDGQYAIGASASIGATVATGYQFKHWTENGTAVSTDNPYAFTVTVDRTLTAIGETSSPTPPSDEIWYTTSDGNAITLSKQTASDWGAAVSSNTYSGGKGIIKFNGTVTKLGQQVLDAKTTLTSVTLPSSITEIGNYAMRSCSALTSITIPENVTSIGQKAWANCSSLSTVYYNATNSSCSASGTSSFPFYNIPVIVNIYVGANVTNLPKWIFGSSKTSAGGVPQYGTIYLYTSTPPIAEAQNTLPGVYNVSEISIPAGSSATYGAATTWAQYSSKFKERE